MLHIVAVITQKCRLPRGVMWNQTNIDLENGKNVYAGKGIIALERGGKEY